MRHLGYLLGRPWGACRYLRLRPAALLAVVLSGRPATAAAQSRIQVTPYFVTHIPILNYNRVIGDGKYIGDFKQTIAPGLGGKLTWWTSTEFAAEVDVNYVLSGTRVRPGSLSAGLRAFADGGHQLNATISLVYRPIRSNLLVGFGAGYMHRGGEAWRGDLIDVDAALEPDFNRPREMQTDVQLKVGVPIGL